MLLKGHHPRPSDEETEAQRAMPHAILIGSHSLDHSGAESADQWPPRLDRRRTDYLPTAATERLANAGDGRFTWVGVGSEGTAHHSREDVEEERQATGHIASAERGECWSQFISSFYSVQDPGPQTGAVHILGGSSCLCFLTTSSGAPPEACRF